MILYNLSAACKNKCKKTKSWKVELVEWKTLNCILNLWHCLHKNCSNCNNYKKNTP